MNKILLLKQFVVPIICLCFSLEVFPQSVLSGINFYVSPTGNDNATGLSSKYSVCGNDGPVKTIKKAISLVKNYRSNNLNSSSAVNIWLQGGTYYLDSMLVITPNVTGNTPTTFANYPGESPIVSGGRVITGWQSGTQNGFPVWKTIVPGVAGRKWMFHQIWVNGERRRMARFPESGTLEVDGVDEAFNYKWQEGKLLNNFTFKQGDLKSWSNLKSAEAVVATAWVDNHMPIESINLGSLNIKFTKRFNWTLAKGEPYYIQNVPDFLNTPGEWTLDYDSGELVYYPKPGEVMGTTELIVPVLEQLLTIKGNVPGNNPVKNLNFLGITFSHNEWYFPVNAPATTRTRCIDSWQDQLCPDINGYGQASAGLIGMIQADGLLNSKFEGCQFRNVGTYALRMTVGCQNNQILGNNFYDLGGGAVHMGQIDPGGYFSGTYPGNEQTSNNEITDNKISDGGLLFHSAVGILIGQSHSNKISHNTISELFYSGISIGWAWGYTPTNTHDNLIEWNHIHHIGRKSSGEGPYLSDMAAYYSLGIQPGTIIQNNLFHDIEAAKYAGCGIYFDQATSNVIARNNIIYNTFDGGFFQNFGRNNLIENNIFAFDRNRSLKAYQASDSETDYRFTFRKNIVYWKGTTNNPNEGTSNWNVRLWNLSYTNRNLSIDSNTYWFETPGRIETEIFNPYSIGSGFDSWKSRSQQDYHSIVQDPLFTNPSQYNFTVNPASPAFPLGFKAFNLDGVGSRKINDATTSISPSVTAMATQSSTDYNAVAARAFDGNMNGDFQGNSVTHTLTEANPWWTVDRQISQPISQIKINNRTDCCADRLHDFYVFVSDKPFNSVDPISTSTTQGVWSYKFSGIAGAETIINVNVSGRYVRIQVPGNNEVLSLAEVQIINGNSSKAFITSPSLSFCQGGNLLLTASAGVSYKWYKDNAVVSTNSTFTATTAGKYAIEVTNSDGCKATSSVSDVSVNPNPVIVHYASVNSGPFAIQQNIDLCLGSSVFFGPWPTVEQGWSWKGPNAFTTTGREFFVDKFTDQNAGAYTATFKDQNGCIATSSFNITINKPIAQITPSGPTTLCQGSSVLLTASQGDKYKWISGNVQVGTNSTYTASNAGTYSVDVTNTKGCTATSSPIQVNINTPQTITINYIVNGGTVKTGNAEKLCNGDAIQFDALPLNSKSWNWSGPNNFTSTIRNPVVNNFSSAKAGNYRIDIIDLNGCSSNSNFSLTNCVVTSLNEEYEGKINLNIYPNPAKDHIIIESQSSMESFSIVDINGVTIQNQNFIEPGLTKIVFNDPIKNGVYFIVLKNLDKVLRYKIVIL